MSFTLSIAGDETPYRGQELAQLLAEVAAGRVDFLILTRDSSQEYVQAAGAHGRVNVERRDHIAGEWVHVKFARRDGSLAELPPLVAGYAGFPDRELFAPDHAARVFSNFVAGLPASASAELLTLPVEF